MIEVVAIFIAAGDGKHARAQDVGDAVPHQQRIARVAHQRRKFGGDPDRLLTAPSSSTPPSEVIRPPSNAAVTLCRTDGRENGSRVSSIMAGVAASDPAEIGVDTQLSASNQTLTLHPPANPALQGIRWARYEGPSPGPSVASLTDGSQIGVKLRVCVDEEDRADFDQRG